MRGAGCSLNAQGRTMLMPAVSCPHQDADTTRRVCFHLLETKDADYYWQFTGVGMEYDLVCLACREHADQLEANLREVCLECFEEIREEGCWDGIIGRPQIRERPTNLSFSHQVIALSEPISDRILDIQPIEALARSVWVALTETGALLWIDLADCAARALAQLPASEVQLKEPVSLHLSMDGHLAAVVNAYGQHGIVLHLHTGLATMPLKRDTYYIGISEFPIAFCELEGRTLLIHGTKWNRLDISDPRTGALLTSRVLPPYERGKSIPEHYLDYFHCSLSISPSQEWIADNGWIWSPVGSVESWSFGAGCKRTLGSQKMAHRKKLSAGEITTGMGRSAGLMGRLSPSGAMAKMKNGSFRQCVCSMCLLEMNFAGFLGHWMNPIRQKRHPIRKRKRDICAPGKRDICVPDREGFSPLIRTCSLVQKREAHPSGI